MNGTLYLLNGDSIEGQLYINNEVMMPTIKVYTAPDEKPLKVAISEVQGYQVHDDYYVVKELKHDWLGRRHFRFMKRITEADAHLHVFATTEKKVLPKPYRTPVYEQKYYMQFPDDQHHVVWPLDSDHFVPRFHVKMRQLATKCNQQPIGSEMELTNIARVNNNYPVKVSIDRVLDMIHEYNRCYQSYLN